MTSELKSLIEGLEMDEAQYRTRIEAESNAVAREHLEGIRMGIAIAIRRAIAIGAVARKASSACPARGENCHHNGPNDKNPAEVER